jgi:hypothetical protein
MKLTRLTAALITAGLMAASAAQAEDIVYDTEM